MAHAFSAKGITLYQLDALLLLLSLPSASVDAVITDPPYSSGGMVRGDRAMATSNKYQLTGTARMHSEFMGDNKDQAAFEYWCALWLSQALRVTKPGGILLSFIDWRNDAGLANAIQAGGWVYRGKVPWNKTPATRPQRGWFRSQCEYILTASRGSLGMEQSRTVADCLPGFFSVLQEGGEHEACGSFTFPVDSGDKHHATGKPVALMRELLRLVPAGGVVLDPFLGGGTTALACMHSGHAFIGCEVDGVNFAVARERLERAEVQGVFALEERAKG